MADRPVKRSLKERLEQDCVICAEGYVFELEQRGYLQAGAFVPEIVLEHPEALAQLHREFVRAGSDIVEAVTYYGHREKLRLIGKEEILEPLNRQAMRIAHEVAAEGDGEPALVAGNICNTTMFDPGDPATADTVWAMFDECVGWAVEEGADLIIAETFYYLEEARLALEAIRRAGVPSVVTLSLPASGKLRDNHDIAEVCKVLEDEGADVVGMNCYRGPATSLSVVSEIRDRVTGHVAALPVPYRTTDEHPTFFSLPDPDAEYVPNDRPFPIALDPLRCSRFEMAQFARRAYDLGVRYIGVCCGNTPAHTRQIAEELGRTPPASEYSPDMRKHVFFGSDPSLSSVNTDAKDEF
jgi:betaine-homocysteine S-methyltransferase